MNINSRLIGELRDKIYRDAYVASQIKIGLPFQARALRQSRGWTQGELAEKAGMAQPRIAEIEKPGKRQFNLETLLRLASAFDVGLEVRFVPITEIIDHSESFDPDFFAVQPFTDELRDAERAEEIAKASIEALKALTRLRQQHLPGWVPRLISKSSPGDNSQATNIGNPKVQVVPGLPVQPAATGGQDYQLTA